MSNLPGSLESKKTDILKFKTTLLSRQTFWDGFYFLMCCSHRVSMERKCPYMKKLKGEGNFPLYFDNNDVTYI